MYMIRANQDGVMDQKKLDELAEYYDNRDISTEIEAAELEQHLPTDQIMVISEVGLPKEVMDRVRDAAAEEGVKPTALMRRWIEARLR